jgi:hypothetical protein
METDPVSDTLRFLEFTIPKDGQNRRSQKFWVKRPWNTCTQICSSPNPCTTGCFSFLKCAEAVCLYIINFLKNGSKCIPSNSDLVIPHLTAVNGISLVLRTSPCFPIDVLLEERVTKTKTPWSESANELYRPSDRRLSAKWLPTFADKGCHVVSVTGSYGSILGFLDRSRYFSIK